MIKSQWKKHIIDKNKRRKEVLLNQKNIKKNIILNTWSTFVYFFMQWLLTVLVTKFLGFKQAGWFTFAVSFTNIFGIMAKFGIRGIQVADTNKDFGNKYISSRIITSLISIALFLIVIFLTKYDLNIKLCCFSMMGYKFLRVLMMFLWGKFRE